MSNILGWEQYFSELTEFLRNANRHFGCVDVDHSTHIIERLQVRNVMKMSFALRSVEAGGSSPSPFCC